MSFNGTRVPPGMDQLVVSFERHLRVGNKSEATVRKYATSARELAKFLAAQGTTDWSTVKRRDVEAFMADQLERNCASTASTRYGDLLQWFRWLVDEEEITTNPMARMTRPIVPEAAPTPVVPLDDLQRLLKPLEASHRLWDLRDAAILRCFIDTGARRSEVANLSVADVDLHEGCFYVTGKFRRPRACPFGPKTAKALDRYLRTRDRYRNGKFANLEQLWVSPKGPMSGSAIARMVGTRAEAAGLDRVHAHQFRHTLAHEWLDAGGSEVDLMRVMGWRSRTMLQRYGAAMADERARATHKRLGLGDRV